jgi:hypothetical protein
MAMMAMTTSNSIKVNPRCVRYRATAENGLGIIRAPASAAGIGNLGHPLHQTNAAVVAD